MGNLGRTWFFYSIIVLFLSGLIVLFLFMARFNNFERVVIEINRFFRFVTLIGLIVLSLLLFYGRMNFSIFINKTVTISTLFNIISSLRLFLICNIIFLVITVSVKLISLYNAPLKRE